jgi:FKBP-type peptidyl-prolyl cis-trans isomerase
MAFFAGFRCNVPGLEVAYAPKVFVYAHDQFKFFVIDFCKNSGKLYLASFKKRYMAMNRFFILFLMMASLWSCKKDDSGVEVVPPRDMDEVELENDAAIQQFLKTHFYNYEEFKTPSEDFDFKIRIDTIAGENADKEPLSEQMSQKKVSIAAANLGIDSEATLEHTYYYLEVREGVGQAATVADSTYVRYEGTLLNGTRFDGSELIPVWFDATAVVRGFAAGTANFKAGGAPILNEDGTFSVEGYGIGFMIFPSAMGYYGSIQGNIPAYSPLIFKIDLFAVNQTDHDRDGIPSYLEDLNGNGYLYDDNTDEEQERDDRVQLTPNFGDADDDGDGTPTREEIEIDDNGVITYPDTDGDGVPDYLDRDNK